ncbi:MAG: hypothetical protein WCV62_01720 [Candidatus Peribacteraceae bacterium]|jgi:GTP cyclohydrolase II
MPQKMTDMCLDDDPISTRNPRIRDILLDEIKKAQEDPHCPSEAVAILRTMTEAGVPMRDVCAVRKSLQHLLGRETCEPLKPLIRNAAGRINEAVREIRDIHTPLLPYVVLQHRMERYNGSPWMVAGFTHDDKLAGTTGGPHLAYIRTPEHIMREGEDFPADWFLTHDFFRDRTPMVRMHSECLLGDIAVAQARCDCGQQFRKAMDTIEEGGCGIMFYIRQEGRGTGLEEKLRLLELAEGRQGGVWINQTLDTETAMRHAGHATTDYRDFHFVGKALRGLGVSGPLRLLTDNPRKVQDLMQLGFQVEVADAAGDAQTIENLVEFLYKIMRGYSIDPSKLGILGVELQHLHEGHRINDALYHRLCDLWEYIQQETNHNVPGPLVERLSQVQHILRRRKKKGELV